MLSALAGEGVTSLRVGDAVFGLAHGCLGTAVTGPASLLTTMPHHLTFSEAATVPTVFITVAAALGTAGAHVAARDRVVVHAAAGGVGLAAIQLLQAMRARACATAGSAAKRALLRGFGALHVGSSRDLAYVEDFAISQFDTEGEEEGQTTASGTPSTPSTGRGYGVDLVLNALTSPGMVPATLAAMALGGRWVEIGKRDIVSPSRIAQERPDVAYQLLAVDFLPPDVIQRSLVKVAGWLACHAVVPLRGAVYSLASTAAAMRALAQASHVGKVRE